MTHQEAIEVAKSCWVEESDPEDVAINVGIDRVIRAIRKRNTTDGWAAAMKRKAEQ